jgi:hypothetical protein
MKSSIFSLFLLLFVHISFAQLGFGDEDQNDPVTVRVTEETKGDTVWIKVCFDIQKDWIIYDSVIGGSGPIPLELEVTANGNLTAASRVKPKLKKKHDEVFGVDILYLEKEGCYLFPYIVKGSGKKSVQVSYTFMSCNMTTGVCLPPISDMVRLNLN